LNRAFGDVGELRKDVVLGDGASELKIAVGYIAGWIGERN